MKIKTLQRKGVIQLVFLLILGCMFAASKKFLPGSSSKFKLDPEIQQKLDLQKAAYQKSLKKTERTYYVNHINDYSGYQIGLSVVEIDRLLSYLQSNRIIYTLKEFQRITKMDTSRLKLFQSKLRFPKKSSYIVSDTSKPKSVSTERTKININTITEIQLIQKFKLPNFIAKRIVKYRYSIGGFKSIKEIEKVYGLRSYQIENIKQHVYVK